MEDPVPHHAYTKTPLEEIAEENNDSILIKDGDKNHDAHNDSSEEEIPASKKRIFLALLISLGMT